MNQTHSLQQARSSSLKGTMAAMLRAAERARELAAQTRTALVVERNGVLEHLRMEPSGMTPLRPSTDPNANKGH